jgi:aspartate kinase
MKVMKFGGSTIKTPDLMKKVVEVIRNDEDDKVVVVSALYGQTNEIREYLKTIETDSKDPGPFIAYVLKRHVDMAEKVVSDENILKNIKENIKMHILKLERLLYGVIYTEELTPRTQDLILSSAERMSAYLMEGVLVDNGISAKAYEADKIGMITDGNFLYATANLSQCEINLKENIMPNVSEGIVPVITGFFGCDTQGRTTTFGKNGSDYSASVIAYSLDASSLELYKDVDGFMSADPEIVKNSHPIDLLSYDEAAELAYFGIDIMHPQTMGPVKKKEIPIIIKNIHNTNGSGTIIRNQSKISNSAIKSVAYSTDMVEIKISGSGAGFRHGILSLVSQNLDRNMINIYSVTTSHTHLSLLIHKNDLNSCLESLEDVCGGPIEKINHQSDCALICVVGCGSQNMKGLAGRIFSTVGSLDVNVQTISAGASDVAAHFMVKEKDLAKTISALHSTFCLPNS